LSAPADVVDCVCGTADPACHRHSQRAGGVLPVDVARGVCSARVEAGVVARHPRFPILPPRVAFSGRQCVCRLTERMQHHDRLATR